MYPKIVVFLAALCIVKASVINFNSLDDITETPNLTNLDEGDQGIAEPQTTRCCDYHECQRYCRGIGYEDGTCTKERCKCINSHHSGEKSEASVEPNLVHNCHSQNCEHHCHKLGYSSGACVNNRCQCDNIPSEEYSSEGELNTFEPQSERNCHLLHCERHCQRLGYSTGACINNRCQCENIQSEEYSSEGELNNFEPQSERNCHLLHCERHCQRLGYSTGACINNRCQCENIQSEEYSSEGELNTLEPQSERNCHSKICEWHCQRIGYSGGACVNAHCQCNNIRSGEYSAEGELNTLEPQSERNCHSKNCEWHCQRLGYSGGACVNNHCQCNNIQSGEYSSEGELNTFEPQSERNCHLLHCERHCQRLGYSTGACINNRCQCENIPSEEYSSEGELNNLEPQSERNCHLLHCERHCQRLGYSTGACINNHCQCDNIQSEEYSSEGELNTLEPQSERNCHSKICEWHCQRIGYSGGACVNAHCQCNNIRSGEYSAEGELNTLEPQSERNCHSKSCEWHCQRLGYSTGACINNHCQCDNIPSEEYSSEGELNTLEPQLVRCCELQECDQRCRRNGYASGACVNGRCKCENILSGEYNSEGELNTLEPQSERNCHLLHCERHCQRLGYSTGACVNGRCQCDNILSEEFSSEDEPKTLASDSSRISCFFLVCEWRCRRLGFTGGSCVHSHCKCENVLRAEFTAEVTEESAAVVPEFEPRCYNTVCGHHCRRLGYSGGACSNGQCKCDAAETTVKHVEDLSSVSPAPSVETAKEADKEIVPLLEKEKEGVLTAPRDCNDGQCSSICHSIGYAGGLCRGGKCLCY